LAEKIRISLESINQGNDEERGGRGSDGRETNAKEEARIDTKKKERSAASVDSLSQKLSRK